MAKGLCNGHYGRLRKHGDVQAWKPLQPKGKTLRTVCRIDGCGGPIAVKYHELCTAHYLRLRRHGDVDRAAFIKGDDIARYWSYVQKQGPNDCWPWTGGTRTGYGRLNVGGQMVEATRFLIEVVLGEPLTDDDEVCHHCDNPPCQNRRHLFVSDHAGNMRDREAKGRGVTSIRRGTDNNKAKITDDQVREIRRRYRRYGRGPDSGPALAAEYGISKSAVVRLATRKTWTHI